MIAVWVTVIIGFIALGIHGDQHGRRNGRRMYRLGLRHGREREAMVARHTNERIVERAERMAIQAYVDAGVGTTDRRWTIFVRAWRDMKREPRGEFFTN